MTLLTRQSDDGPRRVLVDAAGREVARVHRGPTDLGQVTGTLVFDPLRDGDPLRGLAVRPAGTWRAGTLVIETDRTAFGHMPTRQVNDALATTLAADLPPHAPAVYVAGNTTRDRDNKAGFDVACGTLARGAPTATALLCDGDHLRDLPVPARLATLLYDYSPSVGDVRRGLEAAPLAWNYDRHYLPQGFSSLCDAVERAEAALATLSTHDPRRTDLAAQLEAGHRIIASHDEPADPLWAVPVLGGHYDPDAVRLGIGMPGRGHPALALVLGLEFLAENDRRHPIKAYQGSRGRPWQRRPHDDLVRTRRGDGGPQAELRFVGGVSPELVTWAMSAVPGRHALRVAVRDPRSAEVAAEIVHRLSTDSIHVGGPERPQALRIGAPITVDMLCEGDEPLRAAARLRGLGEHGGHQIVVRGNAAHVNAPTGRRGVGHRGHDWNGLNGRDGRPKL